MALVALMIVRNMISTADALQCVWFALFLVLCAAVAFADNDTQILTAGCIIVAIFVPFAIPLIIITRLLLQLQLVFIKSNASPVLPFEAMYPDTPQPKEGSNNYNICF